jgi:hypothetical protein
VPEQRSKVFGSCNLLRAHDTTDRIQAEWYRSIVLRVDHMQDRGDSNDMSGV